MPQIVAVADVERDDCLALGRGHAIDGMTPTRGLMRNPWLIRDVEAKLTGRPRTDGSVVDVLIRLAEMGLGNPNWTVGRLLEIAGMAWGRESDRFKSLVGPTDAQAMINRLRQLT